MILHHTKTAVSKQDHPEGNRHLTRETFNLKRLTPLIFGEKYLGITNPWIIASILQLSHVFTPLLHLK